MCFRICKLSFCVPVLRLVEEVFMYFACTIFVASFVLPLGASRLFIDLLMCNLLLEYLECLYVYL